MKNTPHNKQSQKRIAIVGSGPGGVATAMILAHRGFAVDLFEARGSIGGRNSCLDLNGFKFDVGPTFLMMKFLLDSVFEEADARSADHLDFVKLDPMYELKFGEGKSLKPSTDGDVTKKEIEKVFPGLSAGYDRFMAYEKKRFSKIIPCLQRDYSSLKSMLSFKLMKSVPFLSIGQSVFDVLKGYFQDEDLALLFSFQSKYLGMSAWACPGGFSMLSYIEHAYGVYHTTGGLSQIPQALSNVAKDRGAQIHLNTPVKKLILNHKTVVGVELEDGRKEYYDEVVLNADFAKSMIDLVPEGVLKKYAPSRLQKKRFSCSTYMMYLGLDKVYPAEHHTIVFADDYRRNVQQIFDTGQASDDISFYVRNASVTDPTLAPKGQSGFYILVPVPNLDAPIDWTEMAPVYREKVFQRIKSRMGIDDLESHIVCERTLTPQGWADEFNIYKGATFNLSHSYGQMAYWRPRNRFEELQNCYLVGGGTHPGSGLPTILESARISANLISRKYDVPFFTRELAA